MGFVERIFHPVVKAVERAFTPAGTGGQEAAAQQAQQVAAAKQMPAPPTPPAAPPSPPMFSQGLTPGAKQKNAQVAATSLLGAAAATGQTAKKSLLG